MTATASYFPVWQIAVQLRVMKQWWKYQLLWCSEWIWTFRTYNIIHLHILIYLQGEKDETAVTSCSLIALVISLVILDPYIRWWSTTSLIMWMITKSDADQHLRVKAYNVKTSQPNEGLFRLARLYKPVREGRERAVLPWCNLFHVQLLPWLTHCLCLWLRVSHVTVRTFRRSFNLFIFSTQLICFSSGSFADAS